MFVHIHIDLILLANQRNIIASLLIKKWQIQKFEVLKKILFSFERTCLSSFNIFLCIILFFYTRKFLKRLATASFYHFLSNLKKHKISVYNLRYLNDNRRSTKLFLQFKNWQFLTLLTKNGSISVNKTDNEISLFLRTHIQISSSRQVPIYVQWGTRLAATVVLSCTNTT